MATISIDTDTEKLLKEEENSVDEQWETLGNKIKGV